MPSIVCDTMQYSRSNRYYYYYYYYYYY